MRSLNVSIFSFASDINGFINAIWFELRLELFRLSVAVFNAVSSVANIPDGFAALAAANFDVASITACFNSATLDLLTVLFVVYDLFVNISVYIGVIATDSTYLTNLDAPLSSSF